MPEQVLITGANGFIGSSCALRALHEGYHVKAAVRRQDAVDRIATAAPFIPFVANGALTFALVPNIELRDAFLDAATGCTYIIHTAANICRPPYDIMEGDMTTGPVNSARAILHAAHLTPSIRRIVATSSTMAILTLADVFPAHPTCRARLARDFSSFRRLSATDTLPTPTGPTHLGPPAQRYQAGKTASRNELLAFAACHPDAPFSIVTLLPGYVFGPHPLARSRPELMDNVNGFLAFLFADVDFAPWALTGEVVHIDDVAAAHVRALGVRPERRVQQFLLACEGPHGPCVMDAKGIVREEMPEVAAGLAMEGNLGECSERLGGEGMLTRGQRRCRRILRLGRRRACCWGGLWRGGGGLWWISWGRGWRCRRRGGLGKDGKGCERGGGVEGPDRVCEGADGSGECIESFRCWGTTPADVGKGVGGMGCGDGISQYLARRRARMIVS